MLPNPIFQTIKAFTPVGLSQRKYFSTTAAPMLHPKNQIFQAKIISYTPRSIEFLTEAVFWRHAAKNMFLKVVF